MEELSLDISFMPVALQLIVGAFHKSGNDRYGSESVSQSQHALQTATLAMDSGSEPSLVIAALLHDIGHILDGHALPVTDMANLDDGHEQAAYPFLLKHFGIEVAEPVRLHVAAKRFLCTTLPTYEAVLSPASFKSYMDQGGPMSDTELQEFQANPFFEQAIQLRKWDDQAKDINKSTPPLEYFVSILLAGLKSHD